VKKNDSGGDGCEEEEDSGGACLGTLNLRGTLYTYGPSDGRRLENKSGDP
jgi:hypothetical protein